MLISKRVRRVCDDLSEGGRGEILLLVSLGWFLSLGVRLIFPALLPHIRGTFEIDLSVAGLLLTVLWAVYALGQFPGGVLGDRIGEGRVLTLSAACATLAILAVSFAPTIEVLFGVTALFGLATALYGPTRFTIISDIYTRNDTTAIGVTLAAGNLGNAILPVVAGILASFLSWRAGFGAIVPVFFFTTIGIWYYIPNRTSLPTNAANTLSAESLLTVIRRVMDREILLICSILLAHSFVWQGFTGFYPTYLSETKGLTTVQGSMLFGFFFTLGIIIQPLVGKAGDEFGHKPMLLVSLGGLTIGLTLLPAVSGLLPLVIITVLLSSLLGISPIAHTYLVNTLPTDMQGSGLGLLRTVYMVFAASGPFAVGTVADWGYFDAAMMLLAGAALLASIPAVLLRE